jgi:hypothetical protein
MAHVPTKTDDHPTDSMVALVMPIDSGRPIPGRRDWVDYRDLGVEEASRGRLSTHLLSLRSGMTEPTGWHIHPCEFQWVYMLDGWMDVQFEDGTSPRVEAGSVLFIPGGWGHNEMRTSDTARGIEIFMPPHPGTVQIDVPEAWRT